MNKKEVYKSFGIEYASGKILAPRFGWIAPLLVNGNEKLGKGVFAWSMLPGNFVHVVNYNGMVLTVAGTCSCNCAGCYAQAGNYNFSSVKYSLAVKTILAREYLDFMRRAIMAQIVADNIRLVRIHASGDFFDAAYIAAWCDIIGRCKDCAFWSYTKYAPAENAFSCFGNCNIVKSIIPGRGFNFGKCGYILQVYNALKEAGEKVYICRCGIDKQQHCVNCRGCVDNAFVLFIEHSTNNYNAEKDPLFPVLRELIENQPRA